MKLTLELAAPVYMTVLNALENNIISSKSSIIKKHEIMQSISILF